MLTLHSCATTPQIVTPGTTPASLPENVIWVDLYAPTPEEIEFVEHACNVGVPSRADLDEIESSSRVYTERQALYLSIPIVFQVESGDMILTPIGFILTRSHLVTIRFEALKSFETFALQIGKPDAVAPHSLGAFISLMEAIVDRAADILEGVATELRFISKRVFRNESGKRTKPLRENVDMRVMLRRLGRAGELAGDLRDSLLGMGRIIPYVMNATSDWTQTQSQASLKTLAKDVSSLDDYETHLTTKVQLLLDATLGLVNIEQNNIFRVLTIVSVVGIPPTLIASMYGMNFHFMPELAWSWGYSFGLALIVMSGLIPVAWFKWRGWF
jgi:magnesium transporter